MTAYLFATVDVDDADGYENYKSTAPALIEKHGGRYIVRGGANDVVEGTWPSGRIVVLEFPDFATAERFYDSTDYKPVLDMRLRAGNSRAILVDGYDG